MRCRQCPKPGSPINNLLNRLGSEESVTVLSACAGYIYDGHVNLPEKPYILFAVKHIGILDKLWRQVFSRLNVPSYLIYNGSRQFLLEIDMPSNWPNRDELLTKVWAIIDQRVRDLS